MNETGRTTTVADRSALLMAGARQPRTVSTQTGPALNPQVPDFVTTSTKAPRCGLQRCRNPFAFAAISKHTRVKPGRFNGNWCFVISWRCH